MMSIDEAIAKYKEITNTDAICPAHCNIPCDKCVHESEQLAEWLEELKQLRKQTKTGHWIPVCERLPEMPFGCLVTVEEDDRNGEPQNVLYSEPVGYDGETWNRADGEPIPFEVVAWMPLPEPYKAESEVEKNDKRRSNKTVS